MKRIFVSSTFKDMNIERDILSQQVMPKLNEIAEQYGESISFCDLRWGVDTSELESDEGARKVLSVCLDEIDDCQPYMIVLLGDRYGWIPDSQLIANAVSNRDGFVLDDLEKSVTALEIEYGALRNAKQLQNTLFCFREIKGEPLRDYCAEDAYHKAKLEELKARIIQMGGRVRKYVTSWDNNTLTDMDAFGQMVVSDVQNLMEQEWAANSLLSIYEKDQKRQWDYVKRTAAEFSARETLVDECIHMIEDVETVMVCGHEGSGKTTLLSRLAEKLQDSGHQVLPLFCHVGEVCDTPKELMLYIIDYLEKILEEEHFDVADKKYEAYKIRLENLIGMYERRKDRPLYIIIDGLEKVNEVADEQFYYRLCVSSRSKVKVIVTQKQCNTKSESVRICQLDLLREQEKLDMIQGILRTKRRQLDMRVQRLLVQKSEQKNPLYLKLLIQRLLMMDREDFEQINSAGGGMEAITSHQMNIINQCPDDTGALEIAILRHGQKQIGWDGAWKVCQYLAASANGLREQDLAELFQREALQWNSLLFAQFRRYMDLFLDYSEHGVYNFSNNMIREYMLGQYQVEDIRRKLLSYIDSLDASDVIYKREIVPQCIWTKNAKRLVRYVYELIEEKKFYDTEIERYDQEYKMITYIIQNGDEYGITLPFLNYICKGMPALGACHEYVKLCKDEIYMFLGKNNWPVEDAALVGSIYKELGSRYEEKKELCYRRSIGYYQGACYLTQNEKEGNRLETEIGKLYVKCGSEKDLFEAEKIFERLQKRGCDVHYEVIFLGEKMIELGDKSEEQVALDLYLRAEKFLEYALKSVLSSILIRIPEELVFEKAAKIYEKRGDAQSLKQAINQCIRGYNFCYKKCGSKEDEWTNLMCICLEHWEKMAIKLADYAFLKPLETAYSKVARLYKKWGGMENLRKALNYFKYADVFCKKNMQIKPSREHRRNLAWNRKEQGETYLLAGGKVNLEPALALLQEAASLYKPLVEEEASFMNEYADTYRLMGQVYSKYQEVEYIQKAIACYDNTYKYWACTGYSDKSMMASTYEETAYLYVRLMGVENFKKAIEYFEKSIVMYKESLQEGGAKFERFLLSVSREDGVSSDANEKKYGSELFRINAAIVRNYVRVLRLYSRLGVREYAQQLGVVCKELLDAFNEINWNIVDENADLKQTCRLVCESMIVWRKNGVKSGYYEKFRQLMEKAYIGTQDVYYKNLAESILA